MPPKNSGGSSKFPGGHKVIHRTAETASVSVVTPRSKHYRPLDEPLVKETQYKVKQLIQELHENKNVDDTTKK